MITGIGQVPQAKDSEIWGNGASTARFLARNGVKIVGCDLNIQDAERTKSRVLEETPDADIFVLTANATKSDQVERLVQTAMDRHGRIDILINNVGTSKPGGPVEMSEDVSFVSAAFSPRSMPRPQPRSSSLEETLVP